VRLQAQAVSRGSGRRGGARARERRVSQFPQQSCCGLLQVPLDLTHYPTVYGVVAGAGAAIAYMLSDPLRILIHKPAIITEIVKVARTAQQQGVVNSFLETAVGALDRPVFPLRTQNCNTNNIQSVDAKEHDVFGMGVSPSSLIVPACCDKTAC
jgi:hypothetical protein